MKTSETTKFTLLSLVLFALAGNLLAATPLRLLEVIEKDNFATHRETDIEQYPDEQELDVTDFLQSSGSDSSFTPEKEGFSVEHVKIALEETIQANEAFQHATTLE